jgi:secondary thiamine-phosphate synthase enzyme
LPAGNGETVLTVVRRARDAARMTQFTVKTSAHSELVEITAQVQAVVEQVWSGEGICTVFVPHTTAGITIQENADPDVARDLLYALDRAVPWRDAQYRHGEGNTAAHVKAALVGNSVQVFVRAGRLRFGTWQGIFLCEFDGPRSRQVWVSLR